MYTIGISISRYAMKPLAKFPLVAQGLVPSRNANFWPCLDARSSWGGLHIWILFGFVPSGLTRMRVP